VSRRRPCLTSGRLVRDAHRCPPCAAKHDKARGTRQQRGYDAEHDRTRAHAKCEREVAS